MVPKNLIKLVVSLKQKKCRTRHGLFVAEGEKMVWELLEAGIRPYGVFVDGTPGTMDLGKVQRVEGDALKAMSSLKTPNRVLGVFYMPPTPETAEGDWVLALDAVRDPGNLGTIIRLCDWFGISQLVCSPDTVDCYNPKVLQATMGSIARVGVRYTDLAEFLDKSPLPVFAAVMDGNPVQGREFPERGVLLMGNEAHGISPELQASIGERITIPQYGRQSAESLNVATATAILLHEIRR